MKKHLATLLLVLFIFGFSNSAAAKPADRELAWEGNTATLFGTDTPGFYLYLNARFGFSVLVPEMFDTAAVIPDNSDGIILTDASGEYRFTASGGNIVDEEINGLKASFDSTVSYLGDAVKESNLSGDSFTVVSLADGKYTFQKTVATGATFYSLEITYPENAPDSFKAQILSSAESLKKSGS